MKKREQTKTRIDVTIEKELVSEAKRKGICVSRAANWGISQAARHGWFKR